MSTPKRVRWWRILVWAIAVAFAVIIFAPQSCYSLRRKPVPPPRVDEMGENTRPEIQHFGSIRLPRDHVKTIAARSFETTAAERNDNNREELAKGSHGRP